MILKEKGITVCNWLTKHLTTKGGRCNSSPNDMCWTYWEINPNKIPLTNDIIYEILSSVTSKTILEDYFICISECTENGIEKITVVLTKKDFPIEKIKIIILPMSLVVYEGEETEFLCTNKAEVAIKIDAFANSSNKG